MNERIKLLAEQAGWTEGYYESDDGPFIEPEFNKEKFAELIIRECIERVRNQYIPIRDQTVEGKLHPIHPLYQHLRLRTEREVGIVECGVKSVISLEELIQEQTDKWYKENILGVEE